MKPWPFGARKLRDGMPSRGPDHGARPDTAVFVTMRHRNADLSTHAVLLPVDTPANEVLMAAARAIWLQRDLTGQTLEQVALRPNLGRATLNPLERILRDYATRQQFNAESG